MGDLHLMIIDDVGEVIGREAVGLDEDLLIQHIAVYFDAAVDLIVEIGLLVVLDRLTDDIWFSGSDTCLGFL